MLKVDLCMHLLSTHMRKVAGLLLKADMHMQKAISPQQEVLERMPRECTAKRLEIDHMLKAKEHMHLRLDAMPKDMAHQLMVCIHMQKDTRLRQMDVNLMQKDI